MKRVSQSFVVSLLSAVVLFASPVAVLATSGPTGINAIRTEAGPGAGEITLNWKRYYLDVNNYTILYGTSPGKYPYSAVNVGNTVSYTIKKLTPGVRYYFRIFPYRNSQIVDPTSPEVSEVAATSQRTVVGTAGPYGRNLLSVKPGPNKGQVTLHWKRFFPDTERYHIVYGNQPGKYLYGALNARDTTPGDDWYDYTIGALTSGKRYYFALMPQIGGVPIYASAEVSQVAQ